VARGDGLSTQPSPILITGAAGFIGAAVAEALLWRGETVLGIDNLNSYYDPALKRARLERLGQIPCAAQRFAFAKLDLEEGPALGELFAAQRPRAVVHLAA
jgi:UDP-glucuronate 4-epimerase